MSRLLRGRALALVATLGLGACSAPGGGGTPPITPSIVTPAPPLAPTQTAAPTAPPTPSAPIATPPVAPVPPTAAPIPTAPPTLAPTAAPTVAPTVAPTPVRTPAIALPRLITENEHGVIGTWTLNSSGGYDATWSNGGSATLTVQSFTASSVIINRTDLPGSISAGLTAVYTGTMSAAGNSASGNVTWSWPGVAGFPATGAWSASW